jgi:hypothetical protein
MKPDEKWFLLECAAKIRPTGILNPRNLIQSAGFRLNYKRAWFLLGKWGTKGWYEYGVTLDLGWMTDKGLQEALELNAADQTVTVSFAS